MAGNNVAVITKENFDQIVNTDKPVLIDFWASWCNPCKTVAPVIEELAAEYTDRAVIGKVNIDDQGELSSKFRIMSIPTIVLFKGGQPVDKIVGARPKSDYAKLLDKNI